MFRRQRERRIEQLRRQALWKCWVAGYFEVSAAVTEVGKVGTVVCTGRGRGDCWWAPGLNLSILQKS